MRVNVHYILRSDGTGNFSKEGDQGSGDISNYGRIWAEAAVANDAASDGYSFAKGMLWAAIIQSGTNPQMDLPVGNTTPNPPKKIDYVLNGVYFHRDGALYQYDPVNYNTAPAGTLAPTQFNTYGVNKGSEVNVFIMAQNDAVPNRYNNATPPAEIRQYLYTSGGASSFGYSANNIWLKMGNLWRLHLYQRAHNNGVDQTTAWGAGAMFNHEIGHLLGLYHPYDINQCADTPGVQAGNNLMISGGSQQALTPCQIGIMQNELSTRYQAYTTCGCRPVNSFFTLAAKCYTPGQPWLTMDARGTWADNTTSASYTVQPVDINNQPVPGSTPTTTSCNSLGRFDMVAPHVRLRVTLTVSNGCNTHSSTKYVDSECITAPGARTTRPSHYLVYPNPATEQFTVTTDAAPAALPEVHDAQGLPVAVAQTSTSQDGTLWRTTYRLVSARPGLYSVAMGQGSARTVARLVIQ